MGLVNNFLQTNVIFISLYIYITNWELVTHTVHTFIDVIKFLSSQIYWSHDHKQ
jgi:hypothetical protein